MFVQMTGQAYTASEAENTRASLEKEVAKLKGQLRTSQTAPVQNKVVRSASKPEVRGVAIILHFREQTKVKMPKFVLLYRMRKLSLTLLRVEISLQ